MPQTGHANPRIRALQRSDRSSRHSAESLVSSSGSLTSNDVFGRRIKEKHDELKKTLLGEIASSSQAWSEGMQENFEAVSLPEARSLAILLTDTLITDEVANELSSKICQTLFADSRTPTIDLRSSLFNPEKTVISNKNESVKAIFEFTATMMYRPRPSEGELEREFTCHLEIGADFDVSTRQWLAADNPSVVSGEVWDLPMK